MELAGSKTEACLRAAYSYEAECAVRLLFHARRADIEGEPAVAAALRSSAEGDLAHAFAHLEFLDELDGADTSASNLAALAAAKRTQAEQMYGDAADIAKREGFADAADWFRTVAVAETKQADFIEARL